MSTNTISLILLLVLVFAAVSATGQPVTAPGDDPGLAPEPAPSPEPGPGASPPPSEPAPSPSPSPEPSPEPSPQPSPPGQSYEASPEERLLLARLIRAEAEAEPFEGQVAVGAVVLNRVESPDYPDTITDVIYQVDQGYVQFTPVANGTINLPPTEQAIEAADRALAGEDPSLGAVGFYNPSKSYDPWVRTRPVTAFIGNHVFFK
ncbi:MAG: cell wall hydrolase [Betaproteobacteria bacterium]